MDNNETLSLEQVKMDVTTFDKNSFYHFRVPDNFAPRDIAILTNKLRKNLPPGIHFIITRKEWTIQAMARFELNQLRNYIDSAMHTFRPNKSEIHLKLDGDQWCATYGDFINLEVSEAGFGKTRLEAVQNLMGSE